MTLAQLLALVLARLRLRRLVRWLRSPRRIRPAVLRPCPLPHGHDGARTIPAALRPRLGVAWFYSYLGRN